MPTTEEHISVSVFARTDTGLQRSGNEDAFLVADLTTGKSGLGPDMSTHTIGERGSLMMVSDGMGGAAGGEIASNLAVKTLREELQALRADRDITEQLDEAIDLANKTIWDYAVAHPRLAGMGATITAVLINRTTAFIAHVGDSRAYLIRGDQIKQLTKDQSYVQWLIDAGAIKPEQASSIPQNVIMQALGANPTVQPELIELDLSQGDYLVLCSDGLSNKVEAAEIKRMVSEPPSLTAACKQLVALANDRGGEDNITVVVARFDGKALHSAADSNSITGSFKVLKQPGIDYGTSAAADETVRPAPSQSTTLVFQSSQPGLMLEEEENLPAADQRPAGQSPGGSKRAYYIWALVALAIIGGLCLLWLTHLFR
ncbi:MAG TPA: Stp1/IreP family PP2C-type Ser/Thr phosphatase [Blastocatellia bacterium]|nr:Stp1/IreP family PP2C-type Ser/Thr phosphatase [Blastocatellia bacterium]